jgi:hypothetical protein
MVLNFVQQIALPKTHNPVIKKNDNLPKITATTKNVYCYFFMLLNFLQQIALPKQKLLIYNPVVKKNDNLPKITATTKRV